MERNHVKQPSQDDIEVTYRMLLAIYGTLVLQLEHAGRVNDKLSVMFNVDSIGNQLKALKVLVYPIRFLDTM